MDNVSYKTKDMKGSSTSITMVERPRHDMISAPDPEVPELKPRRNFTAKYKLRILDEADLCSQPGELGAMLRREGLYSSNLTTWRRQKEKGLLQAMSPKKRGRKHKEKNPLASRVAQLEKENRRLEQKLKQAELIIEAQKKRCRRFWVSRRIFPKATRTNDRFC